METLERWNQKEEKLSKKRTLRIIPRKTNDKAECTEELFKRKTLFVRLRKIRYFVAKSATSIHFGLLTHWSTTTTFDLS